MGVCSDIRKKGHKNEENPSNFESNEVKSSIKEDTKTDENKLFKGKMMNGGNSIQNNYNNEINKKEKQTKKNNPYSKGINSNENKFNGNISIQENDNDNLIKFNDRNNMHYIIGHKISLDKDSTFQKDNNTNDLSTNKKKNDTNSQIQLEIKFPYEKDIPNKIMNVKGNFTIDQLEKEFIDEKFVFDRGMSIRNIKKTLSELQNNQNTKISFCLMRKSDKLIKDLEECEINFKNIACESCYQSSTLQGFVHIILPISIKNINRLREEKGFRKVENLDELKNDNIFNNTLIDAIKGLLDIQKCGGGGIDENGNKYFEAHLLFKIAGPVGGGGQGINNIGDISMNNDKFIVGSKDKDEAINAGNKLDKIIEELDKRSEEKDLKNRKGTSIVHNPPKKSLINKSFTENDLVKSIEIKKRTIVSEIIKFKIEDSDKYYGNIVLKFSEDDLKDENLDICKLIENCPQFNKKKIVETSDVLYLITDRISYEEDITKNFIVYERLYFQNINEWFELKFVIYHKYSGPNYGHYVAYSKFRGEWYYFNDLHYEDYAVKQNPPLYDNKNDNYYPVSFYYVKIKI